MLRVKKMMMNYAESITKEEVSLMPVECYEGIIHTIESPYEMEKALAFLRDSKCVGLDTETRPTFQKGKTNTVALLQLSTMEHCFLFRLNVLGIPPLMREFLNDKSVLKVGLSLKDDISSLNKRSRVELTNYVDLQQYVKKFGIQENSLMKIYAIIFGKRISKSQRLSNWEAPLLTDKQKNYAALDAWATLRIYNELQKKV